MIGRRKRLREAHGFMDDIAAIFDIVRPVTTPAPWRLDDDGMLIDANGRPLAHVASRLDDSSETWRTIGNKLAAAPDLETALSDLVDYVREVLSSPMMQEAGVTPKGPALEHALAALAKARQ
jgi:hypothetical protein